jgi:hypothetical protein
LLRLIWDFLRLNVVRDEAATSPPKIRAIGSIAASQDSSLRILVG